jgi:hypothetical protein
VQTAPTTETPERPHERGRRDRAGARRRFRALGLLAASASALALCGCGGSRAPAVASITTTGSSSAGGTTAPSTTAPSTPAPSTAAGSDVTGSGSPSSAAQAGQDDALRYAQCMRESGVPGFPDPDAGGGFVFQDGGGVDPSSPSFKAAQATCRKLLPNGGPPAPGSSTHPSPQALAELVKAAQCMRRHGISDFPDPRTSVPSNPFPGGGGGVISDIDGVILVFPAALDMQSPAFTRAAAACDFPLHNH